jgi:arylsulfatase A-like enzyme
MSFFLALYAIMVTADHRGARPHVVYALIDDLGYHQIHAPPAHVNAEIKSPFIAKLATEGVTLTSHYAYKYCGPSVGPCLHGGLASHQMFCMEALHLTRCCVCV